MKKLGRMVPFYRNQAILDATHTVDIVNEEMLKQNIEHYKVIVAAGQKLVSNNTLILLESFVNKGGTLLLQNGSFTENKEDTYTEKFLKAIIMAQESESFIRNIYGNGSIIMLESNGDFTKFCLDRAGIPSDYTISTGNSKRNIILSARKREDSKIILHLIDITSFKDGELIHPDSREDTDEEFDNKIKFDSNILLTKSLRLFKLFRTIQNAVGIGKMEFCMQR